MHRLWKTHYGFQSVKPNWRLVLGWFRRKKTKRLPFFELFFLIFFPFSFFPLFLSTDLTYLWTLLPTNPLTLTYLLTKLATPPPFFFFYFSQKKIFFFFTFRFYSVFWISKEEVFFSFFIFPFFKDFFPLLNFFKVRKRNLFSKFFQFSIVGRKII